MSQQATLTFGLSDLHRAPVECYDSATGELKMRAVFRTCFLLVLLAESLSFSRLRAADEPLKPSIDAVFAGVVRPQDPGLAVLVRDHRRRRSIIVTTHPTKPQAWVPLADGGAIAVDRRVQLQVLAPTDIR